MPTVPISGLPNMGIIMMSNPLHNAVTDDFSDTHVNVIAASQKSIIKTSVDFQTDRPSQFAKFLAFWRNLDGSIITVGTIVFVGDTSRGILFPVLSTLNAALGGGVVDLGYLVAMFSIGRMIVTAPLGYISDRYRHKLPLIMSSTLLMLGAVLWGNAYSSNRLYVLYIAQFIMGVGSGSLGVTRSFVVEQCEPSRRTQVLAVITALQYAGFTVSPIVGSWLVTLGIQSNPYWSFALPSYLIALLASWCLIALLTVFQNIPVTPIIYTHSLKETCIKDESAEETSHPGRILKSEDAECGESKMSRSRAKSEVERQQENVRLQQGMFYVILGMFLLNIATKGSIAVYETLGAQIGLVEYRMSTLAIGALISGSGAVGFIQLLLFPAIWTKYFTDLQLMLGGIAVMIAAQLIGLSYGGTQHFERYITSVVLMYAVGYPIGHTAVLGAFSKIQKSGPQAALMGWFATAGSLSRIIFPILSGYLDKAVKNSPFNVVLFVLSLSYMGIVVLKTHMRTYIEVDRGMKVSRVRQSEGDMSNIVTQSASGLCGRLFGALRALRALTIKEKTEVVTMMMLMAFTVLDIVNVSEESREGDGFTFDKDRGPGAR